jgi:transcriptional regulator with XRE-family HTH domain
MPDSPSTTEMKIQAGLRLRAVLDVLDISVGHLGQRIGAGRTQIQNWMKGSHKIDWFAMARLEEATEIPAEWVLAGHLRNVPGKYLEALATRAQQLGAEVYVLTPSWPLNTPAPAPAPRVEPPMRATRQRGMHEPGAKGVK